MRIPETATYPSERDKRIKKRDSIPYGMESLFCPEEVRGCLVIEINM